MLQTVKDVSALDPLVDLLESIESILKHLDICTKVPLTDAMTETLLQTLVQLLFILGLATKLVKQRQPDAPSLAFHLTQCNAGTFVKKLFGRNFDQMVLERLDRLTPDEGRITASQILEVVYGLVHNMRVVMAGEQTDSACHPLALRNSPLRRQVIHRRYLRCPEYVCYCQ
jgi:hypothetical protein